LPRVRVAEEIKFLNGGGDDEEEVKTTGAIQDFSDSHIKVNDYTFAITDDTKFKKGTKADMAIGRIVTVEGKEIGGVLTAEEIEFEDDEDEGEVKTTGAIQDFGDDYIVVNGLNFVINSKTKFKHGTADMAVGRIVTVEGKEIDGVLTAEEIEFEDDEDQEVEVEGVITALTSDSLTVADITFTINSKTRFVAVNRSALEVGLRVEVTGYSDGSSGFVAKKVRLLDNKGKKSSVDAGVLTGIADAEGEAIYITLDGERTYRVDKDKRLFGRYGLKATAEDLLIGLTLRVTYKASSVSQTSSNQGDVERLEVIGLEKVKGKIAFSGEQYLGLDSFVLGEKVFFYDDLTKLEGVGKRFDNPGELDTDTDILVHANPLDNGSFLANLVVVLRPGSLPKKLTFRGIVTGVVSDQDKVEKFFVDGECFLVDSATRFRVRGMKGPFPQSDFAVDIVVKVKATVNADGDYMAKSVVLYLPISEYCGEIEGIGTDSLTVLGTDFRVTAATTFKGFDDGTTLDDLVVGELVEIKAVLWPDGSYVAIKISPCDDGGSHIEGAIASILTDNGVTSIVIGGITVRISFDTVIYDEYGPTTVDALTVGVHVSVELEIGASGEFIAREIEMG